MSWKILGPGFLLLFGVAQCGLASELPLDVVVGNRLMTGVREGCDTEESAVRNLGAAVKAAYRDVRVREGKAPESVDR